MALHNFTKMSGFILCTIILQMFKNRKNNQFLILKLLLCPELDISILAILCFFLQIKLVSICQYLFGNIFLWNWIVRLELFGSPWQLSLPKSPQYSNICGTSFIPISFVDILWNYMAKHLIYVTSVWFIEWNLDFLFWLFCDLYPLTDEIILNVPYIIFYISFISHHVLCTYQ